jgi:hypothetical protein
MQGPVVVVALALGVAAAPSSASAQSSSELAAARALFQEGLRAAREARWEDARELSDRSYAIAPRPTTLLNLAGAQVQTGRLVAGAESYRRFLAEARGGREARYRPQAERALAETESRIGRLSIRIDGLTDSDVVMLDGEELARAALGVAVPVDPGTRTIVVRRGDGERARESVTVAEGEHREVAIDASMVELRVAGEHDHTAAPDAALRAETDTGTSTDDGALWIGLGVGAAVLLVVGAAVGIALAVDASNATYTGTLGPGVVVFE